MSKSQRNQKVLEIADMIKDKSLVFIDYEGINVKDFTDLRDNLRSKQSMVKVLKNTLTVRAMESLNMTPDENIFTQMTATAITDPEQFMAASKDILTAEKEKKVKIKGGYANGDFIDSELVRKFANIPGRQDLYGILVATLQQVISSFVFVLEEVKKQKENQKIESQDS